MKHPKQQRRLTMREFLTRHPTLEFAPATTMLFKLQCDQKRMLHETCTAMHEERIQLALEDLPELIEIVRVGLAALTIAETSKKENLPKVFRPPSAARMSAIVRRMQKAANEANATAGSAAKTRKR